MQPQPEKTCDNYNEFNGARRPVSVPRAALLQTEAPLMSEHELIVNDGISRVNAKVNEILGDNNELTSGKLTAPTVRFLASDTERPDWAGYFSSDKNMITLNLSSIEGGSLGKTKVFIHEYLHFLSHNGRDDSEQVGLNLPISRSNNVGFRRELGLDIREGKENQLTHHYFLSFNEAVTEQLAIDIFPGVHETYEDYRGLLNQVIDDAVTRGLGSKDATGVFQPWTSGEVKMYIYRCFFRGDLDGFTGLLQTTYSEYSITEQQFGLMTHKNDLPSLVAKELAKSGPKGPPPTPAQVAVAIQRRLNAKTPDDYVTDVITDDPDSDPFGAEYDAYIKNNSIAFSTMLEVDGTEYKIDNCGLIIYQGEYASSLLEKIRSYFDNLLTDLRLKKIDKQSVTNLIDTQLFETYQISMLSDGFREFYIYKHEKLAGL